jgi:hypothetical protein
MNAQIKTLMEQATVKKQYTGPFGVQQVATTFDQEKFAELIIKESCSQIFIEVQDQRDQQFYDRVTANIKKHFGVGE